jgi:hypothetical protein
MEQVKDLETQVHYGLYLQTVWVDCVVRGAITVCYHEIPGENYCQWKVGMKCFVL